MGFWSGFFVGLVIGQVALVIFLLIAGIGTARIDEHDINK